MFRNATSRQASRLLYAVPFIAIITILLHAPLVHAQDRTTFDNSIKPLAAGVMSRDVITAADTAASMDFMIALKLRNFDELQARIAKGEIISDAEYDAKYMPLDTDYQAVRTWALSQGLTIANTDSNRLGLFLTGSVAQIQTALQVGITKVNANGATYLSASTAPSLPATIAGNVLGINGLQPHIQMRKHSQKFTKTVGNRANNGTPYYPSEMVKAYNGSALTVDGTGQSIAIVIDTFPLASDLQSFWSITGVNQSMANISFIQVVSGTLPAPSGEETLDVEWSSGVAPGAKIRVYASKDLTFTHLDQALQAVINDIPNNPSIHQLSMSYGLGEKDGSVAQNQTDSQYYATLASKGVTCFASSGDGGSTDGGALVQADNPASDPSVTGVGGTSVTLNASGVVSNESTWNGSGGGRSVQFTRPVWQTGAGVPSGTDRLIPDVALPADPNTGCLVVLNGAHQQYGGTSWSSPMWAGFCSRINQARAAAALTPVGILGPKIYPLIGTNNFRDITTGNNAQTSSGGLYAAAAGYDLCTGIGVPNLANLVPTLAPSTSGGGTPNLTKDPNTAVSAPASVSVGANLAVSTGVLNNGTAAAGAFNVTYRLSTSQSYDTSGALIGNVSIGSLASISTAPVAFTGTCPNVAPGNYFLVWFIDSGNAVAESNENDNVFAFATPITVSAATIQLPNLTQDNGVSVTVPTSLTVGGALSVSSGVINNGAGAAGAFSVTYRLSTSLNYDTTGAVVGSASIASLAAGGKATASFTGTCPNVAAGNYFLVWFIDSGSAVTESNENDNVFSFATPITVAAATTALPNLAPYAPQGWSAPIVVSNVTGTTTDVTTLSTTDTLYVDFSYANLISTVSTTASFVVQLSVDGTVVKSITQPSPFGFFYIPTLDFSIGSLSAGSHTLKLSVDVNNSVAESNENDNVFTKNITVGAAVTPPNLTLDTNTGITVPSTVAVGAQLTVSSNVSNNGGTSAGAFVVRYRLSTDTSYSPTTDTLLGDASVVALPAGSSVAAPITVTVPSVPAGTYYLVWSIDALQQVTESNENDNFFYFTKPITVTTVPPPPPAQPVIVSGPTFTPQAPVAGSPVTFAVVATEAGNPTLTYAWTFGDGGTGSGATTSYVYAVAGTYTATVTVSDTNGATVSGSVTVTVASATRPATVVKKSFSINFARGGDTIDVALFSSALGSIKDGTTLRFQIGGQTIDSGILSRGKAYGSFGRFTYNSRSETIEYSGKNVGLANSLAPYNVANKTIGTTVKIPLAIGVGNIPYGGTVSFFYTAIGGKSGKGF